MEQEMQARLLAFLNESPSCYHAVENLRRELLAAGYQELLEFQPWEIRPGGRYFLVRGDSTLAAFRIPETSARGFLIAAGHSDCPTFKVREEAEVPSAGGTLRMSVEPYGGAIYRSWLDRPLSVAGRVAVREGGGVRTRLINVDRDLLVIPSVAIHMDRKVNEGTLLSPATDLLPLLGCGEKGAFRRLIAAQAGVSEEDLLSTELFLYPRTPATLTGLDEEFILSPRLDDLQCVFGCFQGFLAAHTGESVPVFCVFNNEEVGSGTRQGADSTFLADVLSRISHGLGRTEEEHLSAVAESFFISADNAHAIHPAHPEYADGQEFPVLGGGIVVKYNANQRYTTDAVSAAVFQEICRGAGAAVQRYSNRADLPGGSTLGNLSTAHLSVPTVDIGLAQLAMHSCCELASVRDTETLAKAMTRYFETSLRRLPGDGIELR
ncbi:M18 family aminopeptidase [Oscillibacter sp.]|uniref:M18 family aminopeptidase n=1 Tax=Oscillibacter sp. TaxID=1945593 RepID=UPI002603A69D|nr:M18 family aminopeptidase [Oscillibacter sp.]MDD3346253.1 M18 family aminopeptidase [Oscillibacter sp.]